MAAPRRAALAISLALALPSLSFPAPMPEFHLAPAGRDDAPGSASQPWATLAGARDNLRALRTAGKLAARDHATVLVHDGVFPLAEPVRFTPADSRVRYAAAENSAPVFDGGRALTSWRTGVRDGRAEWTLDLPDVADGHWYFRSLFVNSRRAPRARLPKFSPDTVGTKNVFRVGAVRVPEKNGFTDGADTFLPRPGDVSAWPSLPDAEVVVLHYWIDERLPQPRLDPRTGWLHFARRTVVNLYETMLDAEQRGELARYYIDNLFEALTEPGEWYLDRAVGRLYYLPRPGETPENTTIVAPRTLAFVQVEGELYAETGAADDSLAARPVEDLRFEGLTFRHSDWFQAFANLPRHLRPFGLDKPFGSAGQAAVEVPGAVSFRVARGCAFNDCTVEHAGLYAVEFDDGCRDCEVVGCELSDLGGGGIRAGGSELDERVTGRTGGLRFTDNRIHDTGRVFHQGIGIFLRNAFDCLVAHNDIHDTCYTGISTGWSWGYRETISRNNRIENNLVHAIGAGVLSDMGGIYTLGVQPGTVVRGNHIWDVSSHGYGGWGIYPDEGSSGLVIEHNLVHDTKCAGFHIHYGRELVVRHNIFARGHEALVTVSKVEPEHRSANFSHNILVGPAEKLFSGGYQGDVLRGALASDANCVWFPDGQVAPSGAPDSHKDKAVPRTATWAEWRAAGNDPLSVLADPKITVSADGNWHVAADSPAIKLGFIPSDWSTCGPRPKGKRAQTPASTLSR